MERGTNRYQMDSLVRKITEERERFVVAWQRGAPSTELNQIRQSIQDLNDLLWEASGESGLLSDNQRSENSTSRDQYTRTPATRR